MQLTSSNKKFFSLVIAILSVIGYGVLVFAAVPPPGGFAPGTDLDPSCLPGQSIANGDAYDCFVAVPSGGSGWSLTGNSVTTPGTNFIGTIDALDFVIKANNSEYGRFYTYGSVALGGGSALSSNMFVFGANAGFGTTNAPHSIFMGQSAGYNATDANNSNFFGFRAGCGATEANNSNFFGNSSGENASGAEFSTFFGDQSGFGALSAARSNFVGASAGNGAENAYNANFLGFEAGMGATDANAVTRVGVKRS